MKYRIEPLSADAYLNLINQEENPSGDKLDIHYYKIGTDYLVCAATAFGKFMSPQLHPSVEMTDEEIERELDQYTEEITRKYEAMSDKQIAPKLLTF